MFSSQDWITKFQLHPESIEAHATWAIWMRERVIPQPRVKPSGTKNHVIYDDTHNKTIISEDAFCATRYEYWTRTHASVIIKGRLYTVYYIAEERNTYISRMEIDLEISPTVSSEPSDDRSLLMKLDLHRFALRRQAVVIICVDQYLIGTTRNISR